jgi:DNA end-binding protein Ku
MAGHFHPERFDDRYEDALRGLINRKAAGERITLAHHPKPKTTVNLPASLGAHGASPAPAAAKGRRAARTERRVDVENLG